MFVLGQQPAVFYFVSSFATAVAFSSEFLPVVCSSAAVVVFVVVVVVVTLTITITVTIFLTGAIHCSMASFSSLIAFASKSRCKKANLTFSISVLTFLGSSD